MASHPSDPPQPSGGLKTARQVPIRMCNAGMQRRASRQAPLVVGRRAPVVSCRSPIVGNWRSECPVWCGGGGKGPEAGSGLVGRRNWDGRRTCAYVWRQVAGQYWTWPRDLLVPKIDLAPKHTPELWSARAGPYPRTRAATRALRCSGRARPCLSAPGAAAPTLRLRRAARITTAPRSRRDASQRARRVEQAAPALSYSGVNSPQ